MPHGRSSSSSSVTLVRTLTLVPAAALIVTNVLGTGVFTKARVMMCNVGTPWMVLLAYPVVPALFFVASAYLMINTLIVTPLRALAGAVIVSAGLPVYLFHSRRTPPSVQGDTFSG